MSKFRLKHDAEYDPPNTWEEVADLERPFKIRAAREFLRRAAVRLCDDAGLHPDDIIMLFDAIPEWVSGQRHAWKREQHDSRVVWRCLECKSIAAADEWKSITNGQSCCPKCSKTNRVRVDASGDLLHIETGFDGVPLLGVKINPLHAPHNEVALCACEGAACPVCHSQTGKDHPIKNHSCIVCHTVYCPECHGIVTAGMSRAFDSCGRCKC